jgi:hypothetical protein
LEIDWLTTILLLLLFPYFYIGLWGKKNPCKPELEPAANCAPIPTSRKVKRKWGEQNRRQKGVGGWGGSFYISVRMEKLIKFDTKKPYFIFIIIFLLRHAAYPGGRQDDLWREANVGMAWTHRSSHPFPQVKICTYREAYRDNQTSVWLASHLVKAPNSISGGHDFESPLWSGSVL